MCHLQDEGVQSHSVDFRHRIRCEGIVVRFSVQAVTDSWTSTTSSALPLLRAGSADPELLQTLHLGLWVKAHFLHLPCKTGQSSGCSMCDLGDPQH